LFYGDFTGAGRVNVLEAYFNPELKEVMPWRRRDVLAEELDWVQKRFPTHHAYARASVAEILGPRMAQAKKLEAVTLETMLFLNRGDHFEPVPLPREAQWFPAMGLVVADADGDGHEDLFISQNFFPVRDEDHPLSGGRGLWLLGDGKGGFVPMSGQASGVKVYGDQRSAAWSDFDGDGRIDLAVTQNSGQTRLFRNIGGQPGLRVRLEGPPGNPDGIGAAVRLKFGRTYGPAREVQAGSGYWSQNSAVQVMATPSRPTEIEVRWPGGGKTITAVPEGAGEVRVRRGE
jgi:enediyne biosynthesis protein E4